MTQKRILITGASGFLGANLLRRFSDNENTWGTYNKHKPFGINETKLLHLDLLNNKQIKEIIEETQPDICFHLAAISKPDQCEMNKHLAEGINLNGTKALVKGLSETCKLIFGSTDLVFDGNKGWYTEKDITNPINHYAWTKLEAERAVRCFKGPHCIVRLSLMFGFGDSAHMSSSDWLIGSLLRDRPVNLYTDQFRTMIHVEHVCNILKIIAYSKITGTLHLGGSERISRYNFGLHLCKTLSLPEGLIIPSSMTDGKGITSRGKDCSLSTNRLRKELGIRPPSVLDGLNIMKDKGFLVDDLCIL